MKLFCLVFDGSEQPACWSFDLYCIVRTKSWTKLHLAHILLVTLTKIPVARAHARSSLAQYDHVHVHVILKGGLGTLLHVSLVCHHPTRSSLAGGIQEIGNCANKLRVFLAIIPRVATFSQASICRHREERRESVLAQLAHPGRGMVLVPKFLGEVVPHLFEIIAVKFLERVVVLWSITPSGRNAPPHPHGSGFCVESSGSHG